MSRREDQVVAKAVSNLTKQELNDAISNLARREQEIEQAHIAYLALRKEFKAVNQLLKNKSNSLKELVLVKDFLTAYDKHEAAHDAQVSEYKKYRQAIEKLRIQSDLEVRNISPSEELQVLYKEAGDATIPMESFYNAQNSAIKQEIEKIKAPLKKPAHGSFGEQLRKKCAKPAGIKYTVEAAAEAGTLDDLKHAVLVETFNLSPKQLQNLGKHEGHLLALTKAAEKNDVERIELLLQEVPTPQDVIDQVFTAALKEKKYNAALKLASYPTENKQRKAKLEKQLATAIDGIKVGKEDVRIFEENKSLLDLQLNDGNTLLHVAVQHNNTMVAGWLLAQNPRLADKENVAKKTALEILSEQANPNAQIFDLFHPASKEKKPIGGLGLYTAYRLEKEELVEPRKDAKGDSNNVIVSAIILAIVNKDSKVLEKLLAIVYCSFDNPYNIPKELRSKIHKDAPGILSLIELAILTDDPKIVDMVLGKANIEATTIQTLATTAFKFKKINSIQLLFNRFLDSLNDDEKKSYIKENIHTLHNNPQFLSFFLENYSSLLDVTQVSNLCAYYIEHSLIDSFKIILEKYPVGSATILTRLNDISNRHVGGVSKAFFTAAYDHKLKSGSATDDDFNAIFAYCPQDTIQAFLEGTNTTKPEQVVEKFMSQLDTDPKTQMAREYLLAAEANLDLLLKISPPGKMDGLLKTAIEKFQSSLVAASGNELEPSAKTIFARLILRLLEQPNSAANEANIKLLNQFKKELRHTFESEINRLYLSTNYITNNFEADRLKLRLNLNPTMKSALGITSEPVGVLFKRHDLLHLPTNSEKKSYVMSSYSKSKQQYTFSTYEESSKIEANSPINLIISSKILLNQTKDQCTYPPNSYVLVTSASNARLSYISPTGEIKSITIDSVVGLAGMLASNKRGSVAEMPSELAKNIYDLIKKHHASSKEESKEEIVEDHESVANTM